SGERRAVEIAERQIVGDAHARHAGILQRFFRQTGEPVPAHLLARRVVALAANAHFAARRLALPRQHLDQLALAVAGDAGDADDLAAFDRERHLVQCRLAGIVKRIETIDLEPRRAELTDTGWRFRQRLRTDHHAGHGVRRELGDAALSGEAA